MTPNSMLQRTSRACHVRCGLGVTLLLVVLLTGCASPKEPVVWKPTSDRPTVLEFRYGGAFSSQARYIADGVRVCREIAEPRRLRNGVTVYPIKSQVQVFPLPAQWATFRRTVGHLKVAQWKQRYSPAEVGVEVFDGTQWWLRTSTVRRTSHSNGDNAYPTIGSPNETTVNDAAFRELEKAFEALIETQTTEPSTPVSPIANATRFFPS